MKKREPIVIGFSLPAFDVPQKPSPGDAKWTYEEAVKAFEEIAGEWHLRESLPPHRSPSELSFKLKV